MDIEKKDLKADKKAKVLEKYSEGDLNPNPEGGKQE